MTSLEDGYLPYSVSCVMIFYVIHIVSCDCHCFICFLVCQHHCIYKKACFAGFSTLLQDDIFEAFSEYGDIKNLHHGCRKLFLDKFGEDVCGFLATHRINFESFFKLLVFQKTPIFILRK